MKNKEKTLSVKRMNAKITCFAVLLVALLALVPMVKASDWSGTSINSGYAITTDWHGKDVPPGTLVTAMAGTTNLDVVEVKFRWLKPDGSEFIIVPVTSFTEQVFKGETVREFTDVQTVNVMGDWGVQAIFYDDGGHGIGPIASQPEKIAVRATSFFVVPEAPVLGAVAIVLSMLGSLGVYAVRRKKT